MEKDTKLVDPNNNTDKLINENKQLYIKLNEDNSCTDMTEAFFTFANSKS
jgi:hypothetical protein